MKASHDKSIKDKNKFYNVHSVVAQAYQNENPFRKELVK